jgi:hypothetical protein
MGISDTYNGFANRNAASRRGFLVGALSLIAAPALVRASSIMPVKAWVEPAVTADLTFMIAGRIYFVRVGAIWLADAFGVPQNLCTLLSEGRLPEVSAWKSTAGPARVSASDCVSFTLAASPEVHLNRGALPMLVEGRL